MAQAFQTIYSRNYRKQHYCKRDLLKQVDEFAEKPPSEGNWRLEPKVDAKIHGRSRQDLEEQVDMFYNKRYRSTYFTSYCHVEAKDTFDDSDQETADELINRGIRVFKKKTKKLSPPLCTSRRLWGYMRPESLYAPLSTYQNAHDRLAYDLLKDGHPKDDYEADVEENQSENALKQTEYEPGNGLVSMDAVTKEKLDKLDGLNSKRMKMKKQPELITMHGVVCGKPALFTVMS